MNPEIRKLIGDKKTAALVAVTSGLALAACSVPAAAPAPEAKPGSKGNEFNQPHIGSVSKDSPRVNINAEKLTIKDPTTGEILDVNFDNAPTIEGYQPGAHDITRNKNISVGDEVLVNPALKATIVKMGIDPRQPVTIKEVIDGYEAVKRGLIVPGRTLMAYRDGEQAKYFKPNYGDRTLLNKAGYISQFDLNEKRYILEGARIRPGAALGSVEGVNLAMVNLTLGAMFDLKADKAEGESRDECRNHELVVPPGQEIPTPTPTSVVTPTPTETSVPEITPVPTTPPTRIPTLTPFWPTATSTATPSEEEIPVPTHTATPVIHETPPPGATPTETPPTEVPTPTPTEVPTAVPTKVPTVIPPQPPTSVPTSTRAPATAVPPTSTPFRTVTPYPTEPPLPKSTPTPIKIGTKAPTSAPVGQPTPIH